MPVSYNSPARNLFLLGSTGGAVGNFFERVSALENDLDSTTDWKPYVAEIKYNESDEKYILSGTSSVYAAGPESGWIEKRDIDKNLDYFVKASSTNGTDDTNLFAMVMDSNSNITVAGKSADAPWVARYTNGGVLQWQSTSNTGSLQYTGLAVDSNNNVYACGHNYSGTLEMSPDVVRGYQAFVEKYDSNGVPGWGKQFIAIGRDVNLVSCAANSRGEVVAVGYLIDDRYTKGYIVKVDTNTGEVLWDKTINYTKEIIPFDVYSWITECTDVYIDNQDQIYVVATSYPLVEGAFRYTGNIIKFTAEGNMIWQKETSSSDSVQYHKIAADGDTDQIVVVGTELNFTIQNNAFLSSYSRNGDVIWRRSIVLGNNSIGANKADNSRFGLDFDSSFYYLLFNDCDVDNGGSGGFQQAYTYARVSVSGNGLGSFSYNSGSAATINYDVITIPDKIGRLSDGSVRNDTSDFITYPFSANNILFDDLATQIANKKRQMDDVGSFEYSGSPAIRLDKLDQELNLLGDVYSGSGDWLDQSGKGNNGTTSFEVTTNLPGPIESENFASVTSSYSSYGTVAENTVTNDLPFTATHYEGKVRDLQSGGFRVDLTGNTTGSDFFMGMWVKFDSVPTASQMGIDLFGSYKYCEVRSSGVIRLRYNGGTQVDSGATNVADGNWHHLAFSQTGGTIYGLVDGISVVSTTDNVGTSTVQSDENFWFFGGSGTAYNVDAKVLDPFVYVGAGTSGYTVPTAPLIDSNENINHFSGFSGLEEYISPGISISGGTVTTTNGPTHNAAGYWEFDGVDDYIQLPTNPDLNFGSGGFTYETWLWTNSQPSTSYHIWGDTSAVGSNFRFRTYASELQLTFTNSITVAFGNLPNNTWTHIAMTRSNNSLKAYVNGVLVNEVTYFGTFSDIDFSGMLIGSSSSGTNYWDGRMGEIRAYPRALSAGQVFQNYNATKSKYINEAPSTAPKIGPGIVYGSNLLLNYDFGNRATYDRAENLVASSEDFSSSEWQSGGSQGKCDVINTDIISPFGTKNVQLLDDTATGTDGQATDERINIPASNSQDYCFSVYAKKGTADKFDLYLFYTQTSVVGYRLTYVWDTDTLTAAGAEGANGVAPNDGYEDVGNGWYRFWLSASDQNLNTQVQARIYPASRDTGPTGSTYFWGAQVEKGSTPGRYIKTSGTAITAPTTVKNLSSSSYTGTINGATFNPAGYMEFDGVDDLLSNFDVLLSQTNGWTCELWFRAPDPVNDNTASTWNYLFTDAEPGGPFWECGMYSNGLTFSMKDNTIPSNQTSVDFTLTQNQWHYLAFGLTSTGETFLTGSDASGNLSTVLPGVAATSGSCRVVNLFSNDAGNNLLAGHCGEIRLYDKELTLAERTQNFNATRAKYGV